MSVYDYVKNWVEKNTEYKAAENNDRFGMGNSMAWCFKKFHVPSFTFELLSPDYDPWFGHGKHDNLVHWMKTGLPVFLYMLVNIENLYFWKLPNVTMVSNPAMVNIHSSEKFPGFEVLLYHGFSFIYYADQVESIRSQGGQERVDLIMEFLLKRRHLAPTHKSTLYLPDAKKDSLVIENIPDFFLSGHIHRVAASNYRNVTMLNCSCWLKTTEFQEKLGLKPQPGRALLVNLQSRKVKIMKFF